MIRATVLVALLLADFGGQAAAQIMLDAEPDAARVTSDTTVYCLRLAGKVEASGELPPLAQALWIEGRAMCEHGQVRAGLARLRRAMMIIHGGDNH